jgi:hypothetical protein
MPSFKNSQAQVQLHDIDESGIAVDLMPINTSLDVYVRGVKTGNLVLPGDSTDKTLTANLSNIRKWLVNLSDIAKEVRTVSDDALDESDINIPSTLVTTGLSKEISLLYTRIDTVYNDLKNYDNGHPDTKATSTTYAHVKLSDEYKTEVGNGKADNALAPSQYALYSAWKDLNDKKAVNMHTSADKSIYGGASSTEYGHVRTEDDYTSDSTDASVVPSQHGIKKLYDAVVSNKKDTDTALNGKAPAFHSSSDTTYGVGTSTEYGHLKLSDEYNDSSATASSGIAASNYALYRCYTSLKSISDGKLASGHADEKATASKYSHVKLSDDYKTSAGAASSGVAASSYALYSAYNSLWSLIKNLGDVDLDEYLPIDGGEIDGDLTIGGDLLPADDDEYILGDTDARWKEGYFDTVYADDISPENRNKSTIGDPETYWAAGYFHDIYTREIDLPEEVDEPLFINGSINIRGSILNDGTPIDSIYLPLAGGILNGQLTLANTTDKGKTIIRGSKITSTTANSTDAEKIESLKVRDDRVDILKTTTKNSNGTTTGESVIVASKSKVDVNTTNTRIESDTIKLLAQTITMGDHANSITMNAEKLYIDGKVMVNGSDGIYSNDITIQPGHTITLTEENYKKDVGNITYNTLQIANNRIYFNGWNDAHDTSSVSTIDWGLDYVYLDTPNVKIGDVNNRSYIEIDDQSMKIRGMTDITADVKDKISVTANYYNLKNTDGEPFIQAESSYIKFRSPGLNSNNSHNSIEIGQSGITTIGGITFGAGDNCTDDYGIFTAVDNHGSIGTETKYWHQSYITDMNAANVAVENKLTSYEIETDSINVDGTVHAESVEATYNVTASELLPADGSNTGYIGDEDHYWGNAYISKLFVKDGIYIEKDGSVPTDHASESTEYGIGTDTKYGHVKLSDSYDTSSPSTASSGVAASQAALVNAYNELKSSYETLKKSYDDFKSNSSSITTSDSRPTETGILWLETTDRE